MLSENDHELTEDMSLWLDYVREHSEEHFGYFYVDTTHMMNNPPDWDKVTLLDFDWVENTLVEKLHDRVRKNDIPNYAVIGIRHIDGRDEFKVKKDLIAEWDGISSTGGKNMSYSKSDTRTILEKLREKGEQILNENKVNDTIDKASAKVEEEHEKPESKIGELLVQVSDILSLLKDYVAGVYREVPVTTIVVFVGAVAYFVLPIDALPDCIPGVGYIDDVAIVNIVLTALQFDLTRYVEWKRSKEEAESNTESDENLEHVNGEVCGNGEGIPAGALEWCRANAPTALQGCSDEELWSYMQDAYFKFK